MSQSNLLADETLVRNWIESFPLDRTLRDMGENLAEHPPLSVNLVTFGTGFNRNTDGMSDLVQMLRHEMIGAEDFPEPIPNSTNIYTKIQMYTNRVDEIFNSRTRQDHRGRYVAGQAAFLRIQTQHYGHSLLCRLFMKFWYRILDGMEDYGYHGLSFCHLLSCQHGHHRSQAFTCLLEKLLLHHWPQVEVNVCHMDDRRAWRTQQLLSSTDFRSKFVLGLRNALSPPCYYIPLHREATREDMENTEAAKGLSCGSSSENRFAL